MSASAIATKVEIFSDSHFAYFINSHWMRLGDKSLIYGNKIMKAGAYYSCQHEDLALQKAEEYLQQNLYAFLVVNEQDYSARIWHQIGCVLF